MKNTLIIMLFFLHMASNFVISWFAAGAIDTLNIPWYFEIVIGIGMIALIIVNSFALLKLIIIKK